MKILFYTHAYPNYVPDLLLHGLRKLLGPDVIDYPRKDCLYQGVLGLGVCPPDQLCPGWFPAENGSIDREDIWRKIQTGYFTYVVCDYRAFTELLQRLNLWPKRLIVIDGEDVPAAIPPGRYVICRRETDGSDFSIPLPMALPEEVLRWIGSYDGVPKTHSIGFMGSTHDGVRRQLVEVLARTYPDTLFQATAVPAPDEPSPGGRLSRDAYYRSLQRCRIVLSLPGAGYDTFRFWENAACRALHIAMRSPLYIPDDFIEADQILRFASVEELHRAIDMALAGQVDGETVIGKGRRHLTDNHLTTHRAEFFLNRIFRAFGR